MIVMCVLLLAPAGAIFAQENKSPFGEKPALFGEKPDPFGKQVKPFAQEPTSGDTGSALKRKGALAADSLTKNCMRSGNSKEFCSCQAKEMAKLAPRDASKVRAAGQDRAKLEKLAQEMTSQSQRIMNKCSRFNRNNSSRSLSR